MNIYSEENPNSNLEPELDQRTDDMEDEILTLDASGRPVAVEIPDDTEDVEEPAYAEYD